MWNPTRTKVEIPHVITSLYDKYRCCAFSDFAIALAYSTAFGEVLKKSFIVFWVG